MSFIQIAYTNVKTWTETYKKSKIDEFETNNCMLSLNQFEDFMNYIHHENIRLGREKEPIIDGLRIYLVRSEEFKGSMGLKSQELHLCQTNKTKLPQISFVIVPTTGYKRDYDKKGNEIGGADDHVVNGNVWAMTPNGETTGLCPNNCGGS